MRARKGPVPGDETRIPVLLLGLISGTSMDAIDAALLEIEGPRMRLRAARAEPYPEPLRRRLTAFLDRESRDLEALWALDAELGELFATAALALLEQARTPPAAVRAIGSHGQTVAHRPDGRPPYTVQIGDPARIAARTGITTVADFRRADIAAGGQGAPLVPAFHRALLATPGRTRVVLNIGGIANATVLPGDPEAAVVGFDTGPGNTLMDAWSRHQRGLPWDEEGAWARSGRLDGALLERLLDDPFLRRSPPKSSGREHFNLAWLEARLGGAGRAPADVQRTLCELTGASAAAAIRAAAPGADEVVLCGGGVHNRFLVERLAAHLAATPLRSSAELGIDPDWIEAAAFAWLAARTLDGLPGNLPSVTGARAEVVLGAIYPA